jgi:hypothetical protein
MLREMYEMKMGWVSGEEVRKIKEEKEKEK